MTKTTKITSLILMTILLISMLLQFNMWVGWDIHSFEKYKPSLVIVQMQNETTYLQNSRFNYIQFFSQDSRFKKIWSQYQWVRYIHTYAIYRRVSY